MATRKQGISAYQASMDKKPPSSKAPDSPKKTPPSKGKAPASGLKKAPETSAPSPAKDGNKGLVKTVSKSPAGSGSAVRPDGSGKEGRGNISGYRKAAGLLLLVGKERGAEILQHFSPEEVEKIVHEIALMRDLSSEEASAILGEFHENRKNGAPLTGGVETARQMLLDAFGPEKGEALYRKVLPFNGGAPFSFLNDLEHNQIELLIKKESPRVISLVLSHIEPKKASLILENMEKAARLEVIRRMSRKAEVHPEVILVMEEKFRDKIKSQGKVVTQEFDGTSALAGILRFMTTDKEESLLNELSEIADPKLAEEIRERIFTIADVLRISDPAFQEALRDYADEELAVIIKGKQDRVREKFLVNVSERRRERILEESVYRGSMLKKDVDEATRDFLQYLRSLEDSGRIRIPRSEEEYI